jgi:hypothetical protein
MSLEVTLSRIAELQSVLGMQPAPTAPATTSFASALQQVGTGLGASTGVAAATPMTLTAPTSAGQAIVQLVRGEVGQAEQPPGSNDSPRIAEYRTATAGSGVGPWCNYFVSWAAKQAGAPLGEQGQGFGAVAATWDWAQRTGRAMGPTEKPNPGDLIVWDGRHIGMVESVLPDGRIQTIEGNSSNMVTRRVHSANGDGATGYVRMS